MYFYEKFEKWDNYRCIFQFIENKRGAGGQRETFLMQQPASQGSPHVSHTLARVTDRHVTSGGWGSSVSRTLSRAPSRGEALSEFCSDLQLLIPDRAESGGEIEKKVCSLSWEEWLHPWSGYIEKVLLILQRAGCNSNLKTFYSHFSKVWFSKHI